MGSGGSKTSNSNITQNNNQNSSNNKDPKTGNDVKKSTETTKVKTSTKTTNETVKMDDITENSSKPEKKLSAMNSSSSKEIPSVSAVSKEDVEGLILPEVQQNFDTAVRFSCRLVKPNTVIKYVSKGVEKLELTRTLPHHISISSLVSKLSDLQVLDVSGNRMGPASFRLLLLSLCHNTSITTLNVADNQTDTDSAECIGELLSKNQTLICLDVSGNYLGKDYFSRCVGPALATNTTLQMLKCESIGGTDFKVLGENLKNNKSLVSLNINSNELSAAKAFMQGLGVWLKASECSLENLEMRNTGLKDGCLESLSECVLKNISLTSVNVAANKASKTSEVLNLVRACACHPKIKKLNVDDVKVNTVDSWSPPGDKLSCASALQQLSMSGCSLKDDHLSSLSDHLGEGGLSVLTDLSLSTNPDLTTAGLEHVKTLTQPKASQESEEDCESVRPEPTSSLCRLSLSHSTIADIADFLMSGSFPHLNYLNLNRAKLGAAAVGKLCGCIKKGGVSTLVLDGMKLSGSDAFTALFGDSPALLALSLGGCQLTDADLAPLCQAVKSGMPLHMLKLAGNRFTDQGVKSLCDALQAQKTHPLALVDFSSNSIGEDGAERLAELLTHKKHKTQLHSLNMSDNNIKSSGAVKLVSCLCKSSLLSLNLSNQRCGYEEEDMDDICKQVTTTLGIKVTQDKDVIQSESSELPRLPAGLTIRLQGLGGEPGELGKLLDSSAIVTDYSRQVSTQLTLQGVTEVCAGLKNTASGQCVLSSSEWEKVVSLNKDAPSWLKLSDHRARALYMTGLPASLTVQKMEGLLEMEADCNVDEVCLMKETVTRQNNGLAWVLLSDVESVQRAVDFYNRGEARVFSQPFTISRLSVVVDDGASTLAAEKAKEDMAVRLKEKKTEQAAHKALIQRTYIESQERHAYRLAHPAYADGRIW